MNTVLPSVWWWVVTVFLINVSVITSLPTTTISWSVYDSINTTPEPLCRVDTCLNGGTCRELEDWECSNDLDVEHTVCLCAPAFTGTRCEYNITCGGRTCGLNQHCVSNMCVSLTDSADSKAPHCKPGVHPLIYQLDLRDRKKPIVCLDMYYTNASSYCHDKDDSIEFQIIEEEVENLFCLNLDYRLWQTCLHVNATFNGLNFPDKPVSKVTLMAKENDMHPRTDTLVFNVTFNTAPKVEMTSKTYIVNVATQGPQFRINVAKVFGVSDNDRLTYGIRVPHPQVNITWYTGELVVDFDGNEKDISVDIQINDTGIPKLTTAVTVKVEFLILSCDIRQHIYVNYQNIGNPVGKLNCRISKGYDMSDLYIFFVLDHDLVLKLLPDGILKVVNGEYGDRNVSMSVNLKGDLGEINVTVSFSITIADIWTGSYELLDNTWQQGYADQRHFQFRSLQSNVTYQMQQFFRTQNVDVTVNVDMFSKSSSYYVNVHFILIFPNGVNSASAVTELRRQSIYNGSLGNMLVNGTSLFIRNQVGSTRVSQIEYSSPVASNTAEFTKDNTEIKMTCTGTFVQPAGDVTMEWRMTSSNALVVPLSNSRLQTNLTSPYEGHYVGTLTAANIAVKDSGDFQCSLRDEGGLRSSQAMNVLVIPRPVVTLLPLRSVVIRQGEDITLSCNMTRPLNLESTPTFHWYKNGVMTVGTSSRLIVTGSGFLNATYWCAGENAVGLGERSQSTTVTIIGAEVIRCDKEGKWHGTKAGLTAEYPCPSGRTAVITRHCSEDGQWLDEDSDQCALQRIERVIDDIEWIDDGLRVANISAVARALSESTQPDELSSRWIVLTLEALGRLLNLTEDCIVVDSKEETEQFIEGFLASVSNILDSRTVGEWIKLKDTATSPTAVLQLLDRMTDVTTKCLDEGDVYAAQSTNIDLNVGKTDPAAVKDIEFSTNLGTNTATSRNYLKLNSRTQKQLAADGPVRFSSVYYKNIAFLLPTGGQVTEPAEGTSGKNGSRNLVVNSGVLAFNLFPAPTKALDPPLKMNFIHTDLSLTGEDRMCVYLNTSQSLWDSYGCKVSMSGRSSTECSCSHLTNFAVLMSPAAKQILIRNPLTTAEIVCCIVAIVLLVLTVILYAVTWRYIRSDQGVIVIHICVCLALALLLLLIGIAREEFGLCLAFAVAVHFFYMAAFFMMLASGVEALWSDSNLCQTRSKLKPLLIGAWGLTVLVVVISCSQLQVYEPDLHCWLSLQGDMKWLFIVPVLVILVVNFFVTGKMIHNHLARRTSRLQDDQGKEMKSLHWMCFMMPVLGLSWIFGLFTVQDESEVYDYLFAIINVLQGLLICITQCAANRRVREGLSLRRPGDQSTTEGELELDALKEDADKQNDARASGAYHYIDDTPRYSVVTDQQNYDSLGASRQNENVYEDMDRTATQTGLFAREFSEENQYANEQANPVGGANRMQDPAERAKSGDGGKLPSDVLYRNIQDTERRPMIPSLGNRR